MSVAGSHAFRNSANIKCYALDERAIITATHAGKHASVAAYLRNADGAVFQVGHAELFLLNALASGMAAKAVAAATLAQLDLSVREETISQFARQMVEHGILRDADRRREDPDQTALSTRGPLAAPDALGDEDEDEDFLDDIYDLYGYGPGGEDADDDPDAGPDGDDPVEPDLDAAFEADPDILDIEPGEETAARPGARAAGRQDPPNWAKFTSPDVTERDVRFTDRSAADAPKIRDMDIVLFDPTRMLRVLGWIFRVPGFVTRAAFLVPLGILALLSVFHRLQEVQATIFSIGTTFNLFGILAISLVTINLLTRLVVGITIQRRGGEVRRFGVTFMLFLIPRFAIDITGAAKLDREGRIATYAAALSTRFLVFALCTLSWAMSRQSGTQFPEIMALLGQIALFSFVISGFPLLNGEGYQLMCAYFNKPMLRERAFAYLLGREKAGQAAPDATDAWAYSLFGIGSVLTTALILTVLTAYVSTSLEGRFGGTGVMIFLVLLALTITWFLVTRARGKHIRKALIREMVAEKRKAAQAGRTGTTLPAVVGTERAVARAPSALAPARNMAIDFPSAIPGVYGKREKPSVWGKWLRRGLVAGFAIGATVVAFLPYNYEAGGDFVILANDRVQVVTWVASELAEVAVDEGDFVEAGQLLARQVDAREAFRLQVSQANLAKSKAQLQNLLEGASPEEILVAEKEVERQRTQLPYLEAEAQRAAELIQRGIMPVSEAERIAGNFETGKANLRAAEAELERVRADAQQSEIAILEADIQRLEAEVAFNLENLNATEIRAPVAGRVVFDNDRRPVPGKYYDIGALVMEIVDSDIARAEIEVREADVSLVEEGETVRLKFWALPEEEQPGIVSSIAPIAEEVEFGKIVRIKTTLPNPDGLFRPGMTGYAKIDGEEMRVWEAYTRLFVRFFLIEIWGWIP